MNTPNPHILPPDGFYFVDPDGVKHSESSWPLLYKAVREYRIRNGKAVGDVMEEVNAFTCKRYPEGCREVRKVTPAQGRGSVANPPGSMQLAAGVNKWLILMVRAVADFADQLVPMPEAERRANICRKCPFHKPWSLNCGTCAGAAFRLGLSIRKGRDVPRGDELMACQKLAEEVRVSVHINNMKPSANPELPEGCWRKAT